MVIFVVFINTVIALMLLYVAWRLRKLRRSLARIADVLYLYARSSQTVLPKARDAIYTKRLGIYKLRQGPQPLVQLPRVQQVLTLLGVGQQIWQQTRLARRSKFFKKALAKYR